MLRSTLVLAVSACLFLCGPVRAEPRPASSADFQRASATVEALAAAAQTAPGASPALAVVMVQPGGPPRIWVAGQVTPGGRPADADTPFYIASMTKAYVGVLATDLDRRGVLPLDTRLDQVWPGLRIRGAPAAGQATLRELLGHRIPFSNDPLEYRTSYIDAPAVAGYRRLLEQGSEPRARTFGYTNLGWVLYAAAL
ncbi:MAG TPA: serine hydrolase domain-containing protein, partial [Phenylobacterium sp.]|nr:serine hydrolase domain-containing protein [Phenylobacterium sp.]